MWPPVYEWDVPFPGLMPFASAPGAFAGIAPIPPGSGIGLLQSTAAAVFQRQTRI